MPSYVLRAGKVTLRGHLERSPPALSETLGNTRVDLKNTALQGHAGEILHILPIVHYTHSCVKLRRLPWPFPFSRRRVFQTFLTGLTLRTPFQGNTKKIITQQKININYLLRVACSSNPIRSRSFSGDKRAAPSFYSYQQAAAGEENHKYERHLPFPSKSPSLASIRRSH